MAVKQSLPFVFFAAFAFVSANLGAVLAQDTQGTQEQKEPDEAAIFAAGVAAYHAENYAKAFEAWQPLAEDGDSAAQYNLGILYQYGLGVSQDVSEAVKWYMKSADAGFGDASLHLGDLYANGFFGEPDHAAAMVWYEKAQEQGAAGAETRLAAIRARMIPEIPGTSQSTVRGTNIQ
jgi:TPR repeat protein